MPTLLRSLVRILTLSLLLTTALQAQPGESDRILSPEVHDDRQVTFRLGAPQADDVQLSSSGDISVIPFGEALPMEAGADGTWSLTIGPIEPGSYRYSFIVDGVTTLDPVNPVTSASNDNAWSLFHVPGAGFMDSNDVAHGAVAEVIYASRALGRDRRLHVYTPPGFGMTSRDYPVFYLLHGAMDSDDSWSTVGRAGYILDNLIANGEAPPMIVVMPHGHTAPFNRGESGLPLAEFVEEFEVDIKPYIEQHYPVKTNRQSTAIAGLSMGGAQPLNIAFNNLAEYGWIGVFSSGVFSITEDDSWEQAHRQTLRDAELKEELALLWFSTGSEDFVLETTEATVDLLQAHDFDVDYTESEGGHTWRNWRQYLQTFAGQLFE